MPNLSKQQAESAAKTWLAELRSDATSNVSRALERLSSKGREDVQGALISGIALSARQMAGADVGVEAKLHKALVSNLDGLAREVLGAIGDEVAESVAKRLGSFLRALLIP